MAEEKKETHIILEVVLQDDDQCEDTDGRPKEFEQDVAKELKSIPGVKLNHDWKNTGTAQGHYFEGGVKHRVQPDICGTYHGQPFVVDTKLKDNSYVDRRDIDKVYRDAEVLGGDCKPVMVNSGPLISKAKIADMKSGGAYISVNYPEPGWHTELKDSFVKSFQ